MTQTKTKRDVPSNNESVTEDERPLAIVIGFKELTNHPRTERFTKILADRGFKTILIGTKSETINSKPSDETDSMNLALLNFHGGFAGLVSLPTRSLIWLLKKIEKAL